MLLGSDELSTHLATGIEPLYFVFGDEPLLIQENVDSIRLIAHDAGYTDYKIFFVDRGFDWNLLFCIIQTRSLFKEKRLIEIRLLNNKLSQKENEWLQTLVSLCRPDQDVILVIVSSCLDAKNRKSPWFFELAKKGMVVHVDGVGCDKLGEWITNRLARQHQYIRESGKSALELIIEQVEGNLLAANQEILKLGLLYPPGEITYENIHEAVCNVARYSLFKLKEAMLEGNSYRLMRIIEGLRSMDETPTLILWVIVEETRKLIRIKRSVTEGISFTEIMRVNNIHRARQKIIIKAVQRVSIHTLEKALIFAARLDAQFKGITIAPPYYEVGWLTSPDPWQCLFDLMMQIAFFCNSE